LAELVRRHDSETGLLFVGGSDSSDYEAQVKQKVSDSGLGARVLFTGQLNGIGAALDLATVKVLTSHSEGLPRVLIESALASVPSVSTRVSGVNEVYGDYADRFVMKSRDPLELADKLEILFEARNEDSIMKMKLRAESRFGKDAHLKAWREILEID
jgi:glycosyltransferase involved in cell wall biosynthesis